MVPITVSTKSPTPIDIKQDVADALNATAMEAREQALDIIAEKYNLSHFEIRSQSEVRFAKPSSLIARIRFKGGKFPLIKFGAMQTPAGVSVEVIRGERKTITGAFIQTGRKTGQQNIFRRLEVGGKRVPRYPITRVVSISVPQVVKSLEVRNKVVEFISHRLAYYLGKIVKS